MKFNGNTLNSRNHQEVKFRRWDVVVSLIVSSVPRRFWDEMKVKGAYCTVTAPEKPVELRPNIYAKDKDGSVKFKIDYSDPVYVAESRKNLARFSALRIWHGLRNDTTVGWEAQAPADTAPPEEWAKFADALVAEITDPDTGFEDGEVTKIGDAIEACDLVEAASIPTEEAALSNF